MLFFSQHMQIDILELMDLLLNLFLNSIQLLPYSLKCLSKFISILIKKKFPKIKKFEENSFIGQFLFAKILIPILKDPIKNYINNRIVDK